uniref:ATP synthase F0 subunit 6 n=1 Tax=Satsuma myomphala TaxID=358001 RepID=UPI0030013FDB
MVADLFSSMDGARSLLIWLPPLLCVWIFRKGDVWMITTSGSLFRGISELWVNPGNNKKFSFTLFLTCLFYLLITLNFGGLTPYTYTLSSNLLTVSMLSFTLWLYLLLSGFIYSPVRTLAHLAPSGAPFFLVPFLVLIETISLLIRPLTLTVRLIANISAGHIVLGLLANCLSSLIPNGAFLIILPIHIFYTLFEFFVAFIQAYIFSLLITLYQLEHP